MTLYDLTQEYAALYETSQQGEWDEASKEALDNMLASLEGGIEHKLLGIARVRRNMQADIDAIKDEEERLAKRRKAAENAKARLEQYAYKQMEYTGIEHAKDATFTVSLQNNPPSVHVADESKIDARWWIPQPARLDKSGLKKAIQDGLLVEGAELVQSRGVRFR